MNTFFYALIWWNWNIHREVVIRLYGKGWITRPTFHAWIDAVHEANNRYWKRLT